MTILGSNTNLIMRWEHCEITEHLQFCYRVICCLLIFHRSVNKKFDSFSNLNLLNHPWAMWSASHLDTNVTCWWRKHNLCGGTTWRHACTHWCIPLTNAIWPCQSPPGKTSPVCLFHLLTLVFKVANTVQCLLDFVPIMWTTNHNFYRHSGQPNVHP